jgi:hypothetical protein
MGPPQYGQTEFMYTQEFLVHIVALLGGRELKDLGAYVGYHRVLSWTIHRRCKQGNTPAKRRRGRQR